MKKFLTLLAAFGCAVALAACSSNKVNYDELAGHRFVLVSHNGIAPATTSNPVIEFRSEVNSDLIKVSGKMCNGFNATAKYTNGVLQSNQVAMTKAICSETELNMLDIDIVRMLADGVKVKKSGDKLILSTPTQTLIYQNQDIKN
ncbi:META domain-containing protein [Orbaceae bacterium ac157xtp]